MGKLKALHKLKALSDVNHLDMEHFSDFPRSVEIELSLKSVVDFKCFEISPGNLAALVHF